MFSLLFTAVSRPRHQWTTACWPAWSGRRCWWSSPPAEAGSDREAAGQTRRATSRPASGQSGDLSLVQIHPATVLWLVEIVCNATPALLCHKDTVQGTQSPLLHRGISCLSLFLYGIRIGSEFPSVVIESVTLARKIWWLSITNWWDLDILLCDKKICSSTSVCKESVYAIREWIKGWQWQRWCLGGLKGLHISGTNRVIGFV